MVGESLALLAPAAVRTAAAVINERHVAGLHAIESAHIERSVLSRRHEFATGRHLLRSLIGEDVPIPATATRAPLLPPGLVGSLAHDAELAVAAISHTSATQAIGLDIEPAGAMSPEERAIVVRDDDDDADPRLIFVLKEATYKAWSGLGGRMLDFSDVRLTVDDGHFLAEVLPDERTVTGRWTTTTGRWLALAIVPLATSPE